MGKYTLLIILMVKMSVAFAILYSFRTHKKSKGHILLCHSSFALRAKVVGMIILAQLIIQQLVKTESAELVQLRIKQFKWAQFYKIHVVCILK